MYISEARRAGKPIALIPSREWKDIDLALSLVKTAAQMRQSKIVLVSATAGKRREAIKAKFGCEIVEITTAQAVEAHKAADEKLATALADELFLKPAKRVVEPSREEVVKSARMLIAMRKMLAEHRAQAITVNCLGGIPIGVLGYPCLGFAQLCDEGYPGACEADLDSTLTMLLFQYAFNKPGFITDPLFDLSKNAVIHAHCVSPTRMDGPKSSRAPFSIRTHRDDNRGASLEVDLKVGQPITCARFYDDEGLLISSGKIIEGKVPQFDDAGCRTQITVEVKWQRAEDAGQLVGGHAEVPGHPHAAAPGGLLRGPHGGNPSPIRADGVQSGAGVLSQASGFRPSHDVAFMVPIDPPRALAAHLRMSHEVVQCWLDDMLVVQERLGVLDRRVLGAADVMLLPDVVVPVNALGEKAMRAVVVFRGGAEDGERVSQGLAVAGVGVGLQVGQGRLGILPHVRGVPAFLHPQQARRRDAIAIVVHLEAIQGR